MVPGSDVAGALVCFVWLGDLPGCVMSGEGSTGVGRVRAPLTFFSSIGCGVSALRQGQRRNNTVSVSGIALPVRCGRDDLFGKTSKNLFDCC